MINPFFEETEENLTPVGRGRGIRRLRGDERDLDLRSLPGDIQPLLGEAPGEFRFAGSKIKGLSQLDPTIFAKLFP